MNNNPPSISSSRWGARTKRIVVLVSLAFLVLLAVNLLNIFPLLILSTLLSYLLFPIVMVYERYVLKFVPFSTRTLSVVLTFVTVIGGIGLAIYLTVPVFFDQLAEFGEDIPELVENFETDVERILAQPIEFNGEAILVDGEPIIPLERFQEITGRNEVSELIQLEDFDIFAIISSSIGSLGGLTGPAFGVLGGFFNTVVNIGFLIVLMFYMMRDGEYFIGQIVGVVPPSYQGDVRRLLYELGQVWHAYLRGQLLLCTIIGFGVYFAALILGLPNAPLLGLIAGVLEFIPNIGPFIALIPAFITALVSTSATFPFLSGLPLALIVIVVWTGMQNIEALVIVPRVMGGSLNLHPMVIILALIAGASIAGAVGIILAAPFTASARILGQYVYGKLFDLDPFPNPKPYKQSYVTFPMMLRSFEWIKTRGRRITSNTQ